MLSYELASSSHKGSLRAGRTAFRGLSAGSLLRRSASGKSGPVDSSRHTRSSLSGTGASKAQRGGEADGECAPTLPPYAPARFWKLADLHHNDPGNMPSRP